MSDETKPVTVYQWDGRTAIYDPRAGGMSFDGDTVHVCDRALKSLPVVVVKGPPPRGVTASYSHTPWPGVEHEFHVGYDGENVFAAWDEGGKGLALQDQADDAGNDGHREPHQKGDE